ncbi:MAG: NAD(P)H-quinone oxidoreductase subunit O [Cyanobacteriota bacterium]|nr:NAD(P)H-quinone oxidoreductase subunit O [Cyanobacteriota bacterium]
MADPASPSSATATATAAVLKKGSLVRLNPRAYKGSVEAAASDGEIPDYVLAGPGEILMVKGEHAQIRWRRPVPDVWLRLDQLEAWGS